MASWPGQCTRHPPPRFTQRTSICRLRTKPLCMATSPGEQGYERFPYLVHALADLLGIKIDYSELKQAAAEARERMKQIAAEAMEEYIDYFTEPIWEREEDEPEEG